MNPVLWEKANGVLAIFGLYFLIWLFIFIRRELWGRFLARDVLVWSLGMIVLGHVIKDGSAWWSRYWINQGSAANVPAELIMVAVVLVAVGKLGCIYFWTSGRGNWAWLLAVVLGVAFLWLV